MNEFKRFEDRLTGLIESLSPSGRRRLSAELQFGLSEETRKDGKKIDYPARPLLGFTGEDVQMIEEIILAHLDR
ncbi:hypothetical protein E9T73_002650 [Escherichia coli]|nr:hypothetical protein [Escherichia coli]